MDCQIFVFCSVAGIACLRVSNLCILFCLVAEIRNGKGVMHLILAVFLVSERILIMANTLVMVCFNFQFTFSVISCFFLRSSFGGEF